MALSNKARAVQVKAFALSCRRVIGKSHTELGFIIAVLCHKIFATHRDRSSQRFDCSWCWRLEGGGSVFAKRLERATGAWNMCDASWMMFTAIEYPTRTVCQGLKSVARNAVKVVRRWSCVLWKRQLLSCKRSDSLR